jgi:molybdopterin/thiamine biosynthesis adenylyltransferase
MTEVVMTQTPPVLQGPSEKERKYDRQLRLWAASGQAALESANLLLVNSGSGTVGVETLKNLVLPGMSLPDGPASCLSSLLVADHSVNRHRPLHHRGRLGS